MLTYSARRYRWTAIATLIVSMGLLATATGTASAQRIDAEPSAENLDVLNLRCGTKVLDSQRGVLCRWSATQIDPARAYQLFRIVDGMPRELVATIPANARRGHFDTAISSPSTITYGVIARDQNGRLVAQSRPAVVQIGADRQEPVAACDRRPFDGEPRVVCPWSDPVR